MTVDCSITGYLIAHSQNGDVLVTLKIARDDLLTYLDSAKIKNPDYARFHFHGKAQVYSMVCMDTGKSISSEFFDDREWSKFICEDGESVADYHDDLAFYLTPERARFAASRPSKFTGTWKVFNDTGALARQEQYVDGSRHGVSRVFDSDTGRRLTEMDYKDGKLNGCSTTWYSSGNTQCVQYYKDDRLNGECVEYFDTPDKWVKYRGVWENGVNLVKEYYNDTGFCWKRTLSDTNGKLHGQQEVWWGPDKPKKILRFYHGAMISCVKTAEDGTRLLESHRSKDGTPTMLYYIDRRSTGGGLIDMRYDGKGRSHGDYHEVDCNGLVTDGAYCHGEKTGRWVTKDSQENLVETVKYRHGTLAGIQRKYFVGSNKLKEEWCHKEEGYRRRYVLKGDKHYLHKEHCMKNGRKRGSYKKYNADATVIKEGHYTNGVKTNHWIDYWSNGKREFDRWYDRRGKLSGSAYLFYQSGNLKTNSRYFEGRLCGHFVAMWDNCNIHETGSYLMGHQDGVWITNDSAGRIQHRAVYAAGNLLKETDYTKAARTTRHVRS